MTKNAYDGLSESASQEGRFSEDIAEKDLLEVFIRQVKEFATKPALIDGDHIVTYSQLDGLANGLASLIVRNLQPQNSQLLATLLPQGKDFIVTTIASFKISFTCCPLSIEYPLEKIQFMLEDMGKPILISTREVLQVLNFSYPYLICLDETEINASDDSDWCTQFNSDENPMAYVFYTSGSTGTPKAVTVDHKPLVFDTVWAKKRFQFKPTDRSILFLNPAFAFSAQDIWPCLLAGGTLVVPPSYMRYDLAQLRDWMNTAQITFITLPAPLAEQFYTLPPITNSTRNTLRWLNCGSGMLTLKVPAVLSYGVSYCYGSTEALRITEHCLHNPFEGHVPEAEFIIEKHAQTIVGKPVNNVEVYILDDCMEITPYGNVGEIYVGGIHVSRGYFNRKDLTNQKFLKNPFANGRLYRTGDFGCWLEDGCIEIKGRVDEQVKVNGNRVELGEIRQLLLNYSPEVKNVVILPESDKPIKIHAFCEVTDGYNWSDVEVYSYLQTRLAHYALPTTITRVQQFPLNTNGKLDRLKLLEMKQYFSKTKFFENKTDTEKIISNVFGHVLKISTSEISIGDNFFALGGSSMLGAKMVAILQDSPYMFRQLKMFHLFAHPTVQQLAKLLDTPMQGDTIPKFDVQGLNHNNHEFPLSYQQEQIWLYMQQTNYPGLYIKLSSITFPHAHADIFLIEKCINSVLDRHPVLKVDIFERNGLPVQIVRCEDSNKRIVVIDLSDADIDEAMLLTNLQVKKAIEKNLDDNFSLFIKFLIVKTKYAAIVIVFSHHLVIDGIGIRLLHLELTNSYYSLKSSQTLSLPNVTYSYFDYILYQKFANHNLEDKLLKTFWNNNLSGIRPLELQTDLPRMSNLQHKHTGISRFSISPEISTMVNEFARRNQTTLFISLMSAFKALCFRYTRQEDIFIMIPTDGRVDSELEPLIGHFVNMIIVRDFVSGNDTFTSLVKKVGKSIGSSLEHQGLPLQNIIKECGLDKVVHGLLRVCIGMEPKLFTESILESNAQYHLASNIGTTIFELFINFEEVGDGSLRGMIEYDRNLYTSERIQQMISNFTTILTNAVTYSAIPIDNLELICDNDKANLAKFGCSQSTNVPIDNETTLLTMFNAQVLATPNAVAIEDENFSLTYAELNFKSEKLSLRLGSGSIFVSVLLPADFSYVIASLAILKCGKAIVPIDIRQPKKQILKILEGLNNPMLLTTSHLEEIHKYRYSFCIDEFDYFNNDPLECLFHNPSSGNISYIFHTSGSTGVPKPVEDENKGLVNVVKWFAEELQIGQSDRQLMYTSPGFDGSIAEIWPCLVGGGTLVICPKELRYEIDQLRQWINIKQITRANFTSVMAESFFNVELSKFDNSSLRSLVCGGERLSQLPPKNLPFKVFHVYGVTEASVWTTANELVSYHKNIDNITSDLIPVGRPIANVDVYVLDANLKSLPIGITGEIFIGGLSVSSGYYNKPDRNIEKFLPNPMKSSDILYRTGDLGYWLPDGNLVCQGRIDEQVKIRGFRIELTEIENSLLKFPSITSAVVVSEKTEEFHQLHAFCTTFPTEVNLPFDDVNFFLSECLPSYSLPSTLTQLPQFPYNTSGKVDKKALLELKSDKMSSRKIALPESKLENILLQVWSEILGLEAQHISVTDNFFALGGNSLLIAKLVNQLRRKIEEIYLTSVELNTATVFACPTIRKLGDGLATLLPTH